MSSYAAVDLGAESGRVVVGSVDETGLDLREVHRFANRPVRTPDGLHWDVLGIFASIVEGIGRALRETDGQIASVGVDGWGVDYGLLDARGRLLGLPYHYRDARTDRMRDVVAQRMTPAAQYARTGIAQMSINTYYQLAAHAQDDATLDLARSFLMIPDLMHYWLTGERAIEITNASTTGLLAVDGTWATEVAAAAGIPVGIFAPPIEPASALGTVRADLDLGLRRALPVVAPATHDTACAVVAAPLHVAGPGQVCAYISSGTWSLLGVELPHPVLSEAARSAGFTNERGIAGSIRFLRNIMGMWLIAECRRAWRRAGLDIGYDELTERAAAVASPASIVDVDDPALLHPADMPAALHDQLRRGGQPVPADAVGLTRAIFEGLALGYRRAIADVERLAGVEVGAIAIVGGGAHNALLCQLAADACGRVVYAGPAEASAGGNILIQAIADRALASLSEIRAFVRSTARPRIFTPASHASIDWAARDAALTELRHRDRDAVATERTSHV